MKVTRTGVPILERQLMAWLWQNPSKAGEFPKLGEMLADPLAKVVHTLILGGVKGNAVALASALTRAYKPYTPDLITSEMLQLADPQWGEFKPQEASDQIEAHFMRENEISLMETTLVRVRSGAETFQNAATMLFEESMKIKNATDLQGISTADWETWGEVQAEIQKQKLASGKVLTLSPNLSQLSNLIPRIPEGILMSYLGLPGSGKTALATELAHHWGRTTKTPIMFCETELLPEQLFWRRMSAITKTPYAKLADGYWSPMIAKAAKDAKDDGVLYVNTANWTVQDIVAAASRYKVKPHIVIDYMGMLTWRTDKGTTETEAIGQGLNLLKQYAGKYGVIVFCNWQTGKEGHSKTVLRGTDASGSYSPYTRSNIYLVANFPVAEATTNLIDPFTKEKIIIQAGKTMPCGDVMVERNTFGDLNGKHQMIWRDAFFTLRGLDDAQSEMFQGHIQDMFKGGSASTKKEPWKKHSGG